MHFSGTLTHHHSKQHIGHPFDVPAGTTALDVRFSFAPETVTGGENMLCLSLFDPETSRGAGHRMGALHEIHLSAAAATPGYVAGALQPGRWTVFIDTHQILPNEPITYRLDITLSSEPVDETAPLLPAPVLQPRGPGWYRGDLHAHTIHSDAVWDVPDFVADARKRGLDFTTLTDHNTVSPLRQMDSLSSDALLTMGGIELTTYYGHALALGLRTWTEWRAISGALSMPQIAAQVTEAGGLFIIAHPCSVGEPLCTGCDWAFDDMMPGSARLVEIWNGVWNWMSNNDQAVNLWYGWLNGGIRITATAGTDLHGPLDFPHQGYNVVYADERSERAILDAVRAGRSYLSSGPTLELSAQAADGSTARMGELLPAGEAAVHALWSGSKPGDTLYLIVDGVRYHEHTPAESGRQTWHLPAGTAHWCTLELRSEDGFMRAITNPIFFGSPGEWR